MWDSTDDEIDQFDNYNGEDDESTVASTIRSHTSPNHHIIDKKQVNFLFFCSIFI